MWSSALFGALLSARNGDRGGARNVALLLTDWRDMVNTDQLEFEAAAARAAGVHVFAVAVGDQVNERALRQLTSPPQVSEC